MNRKRDKYQTDDLFLRHWHLFPFRYKGTFTPSLSESKENVDITVEISWSYVRSSTSVVQQLHQEKGSAIHSDRISKYIGLSESFRNYLYPLMAMKYVGTAVDQLFMIHPIWVMLGNEETCDFVVFETPSLADLTFLSIFFVVFWKITSVTIFSTVWMWPISMIKWVVQTILLLIHSSTLFNPLDHQTCSRTISLQEIQWR